MSTASTTPCPSAPTSPTASSDRSGAYDANAKPAAASAAPATATPASASPAAPGLKLSRPTPIMSPTVRPAATPAMMPAVSSMASSSRALAVTGKPVMASWVAPIRPIPASSITIPVVTTREGFTSSGVAAAVTAMSVATKPPDAWR